MAPVLLVLSGLVCAMFGILLAFTVFGIAALVVGAGCAGAGMLLLVCRFGPGQGKNTGSARPR